MFIHIYKCVHTNLILVLDHSLLSWISVELLTLGQLDQLQLLQSTLVCHLDQI